MVNFGHLLSGTSVLLTERTCFAILIMDAGGVHKMAFPYGPTKSKEEWNAAKEALRSTPEWKAAGRIVTHMWIIFLLLPVVLVILYAVVT